MPSSFIQSDLFTFYIGEEKKPFIVHSSAVAATSEYFRALVKGDMSEAETKSAELTDIEPDDFVRFLEYAYRGDYTVPSWALDESAQVASDAEEAPAVDEEPPPPPEADGDLLGPPPPEPEPEPVLEGEASSWGTPSKKKGKKKREKLTLRMRFQRRSYLTDGAPHALLTEGFQPKSNAAANQDFAPVFLAHARLYTFAEMRLILPLKELALHKLHKTLLEFQLYHQRVGDVVELAQYAYDHGPARSDSGILNDLRQLVVEYMACEVDVIGKHDDFRILMEGGGEFVSDFWGIVTRYLL